jgi:hypothetical protein
MDPDALVKRLNRGVFRAVAEYEREKPKSPAVERLAVESSKFVGNHTCRHWSDGYQCNERVYRGHDTYCYYHKKISDGLTTPIDKEEQKVWRARLGSRYGGTK